MQVDLSTCSSWPKMQNAVCVRSQQDAARDQHSGSDGMQQRAPPWLQVCTGCCIILTYHVKCQTKRNYLLHQSAATQQAITQHTRDKVAWPMPAQASCPHRGSKAAAEGCEIEGLALTRQSCGISALPTVLLKGSKVMHSLDTHPRGAHLEVQQYGGMQGRDAEL